MTTQTYLSTTTAQHPWLGLLPYREEHREFFFGRDREVEEILARIRSNRLTILYGQSGLGKSSLLAAGVVPRLRDEGHQPAIVRLSYACNTERLTLRSQTLAALGPQDDAAEIQNHESLWSVFNNRSTTSPIPVLIFDQFEEIFTFGAQPQFQAEVTDWLEQMADLLQNRPPRQLAGQYHFGDAPVRIIFTLREDYLAQLERWKAQLPLLMQNRMALTMLTGPQARQAVLGPAQLGDHSLVSREVAESIVRTVARAPSDTPMDHINAVPPLLSLLCEQLNASRLSANRPQITAESVRDQADDILQRFYAESFLSFPHEHRSRIRALLEDPPMITEAGYRNALVRDDAEAQLTRAGVTDAKTIFDTLIQRRLITAETRDNVQRLEITHDILVPLLVRSRKERHDREAKEHARNALADAELRTQTLRWQRIQQLLLVALALFGFLFGIWQMRVAMQAQETLRVLRGVSGSRSPSAKTN